MRVLIPGANGMVARVLVQHCRAQGDEVYAYNRQTLNISHETSVREMMERVRPDTVINCAAWTDVDGCESDAARAYDANARGPEVLAENCRRFRASLVTVSTDYVFDGTKDGFYTQRDDPNPQSVYGKAKLEGERRAQSRCARTMVVRTGWIFGPGGKNFLSRIIELARGNQRLTAISDSFGTPTYAIDLAARLRHLAELDLPGIYHVTNSGEGASFEEFARMAIEIAGCDAKLLQSVEMDSLKRPAPRPRNSRLRCLLSEAIALPPLPHWHDGLKNFALTTADSTNTVV